jgi:hypothetical protein
MSLTSSFCFSFILSVILLLNLSVTIPSEIMASPLVFATADNEEEGQPEEGQPEGGGAPEGGADEGALVPLSPEICGDGVDNNGDGQIDEGCSLGAESVPLPPEGSDFTGVQKLPPGKLILPPEGTPPGAPFEAPPPAGFDPNLPLGTTTPPPPDGTTPPPVGFDPMAQTEPPFVDKRDFGPGLLADSDNDGIENPFDNCPFRYNREQQDSDGDGDGDACDYFDEDLDDDGHKNSKDNCPGISNPGQKDTDFDGEGDECDPSFIDDDHDGLKGAFDNCPRSPNPDQKDSDGDKIGDACDPDLTDSDGDGVVDSKDNCPYYNPDQAPGCGPPMGSGGRGGPGGL